MYRRKVWAYGNVLNCHEIGQYIDTTDVWRKMVKSWFRFGDGADPGLVAFSCGMMTPAEPLAPVGGKRRHGGSGEGTARFTLFIAPDVRPVTTRVDIWWTGPAIETWSSPGDRFRGLPPGTPTLGSRCRSAKPYSKSGRLTDGQVATVVAIRTVVSRQGGTRDVLVFDRSTEVSRPARSGLVNRGRRFLPSVVDVIATEPARRPWSRFLFGTVRGALDLPAADYSIGIAAVDSCSPAAGPLVAPVTADVVTLLIAVDNDTMDEALAPAVYALIDDFSGTDIPTLPAVL
jgi:hypothetical protein